MHQEDVYHWYDKHHGFYHLFSHGDHFFSRDGYKWKPTDCKHLAYGKCGGLQSRPQLLIEDGVPTVASTGMYARDGGDRVFTAVFAVNQDPNWNRE